ncbi:MAG TPA: carboxypeptidase-like regulatory domain-containing protein, partial [Bryobacteraceae bacterium]|nr:carboxypeptidase-like regulatory domain-containing protein [Bryobacteraceae bacterium]
VPNLLVGTYTVTAEMSGFKKTVQTGVVLDSAARVSADLTLTVGAVSESVEVQSNALQVQTETAQVGRVVDSKQIADLTLNGRNPIYLALLKPGVAGGSIGTFDPDSVSNGGFSINGGRADEYLVTVDGAVATRTRSSGSMLGAQDVDTVAEVQILTANYNAEYGRASGGQIRFVTKSGTKNFHGDLVENFRNSGMDANDWTRNHSPLISQSGAPAPFRFNQFGWDVGGPVFIPKVTDRQKTKLYFFWAEEFVRRREGSTATGTVPTQAMRNGDLSELLNPANLFFKKVVAVNDPTTSKPFPGNIIPQNRISHNGQALMNAYPLPTAGFIQGTSNYIVTYPHYSDTRKDTVKVDYAITDSHRLSFRGTHIPWHFDGPYEGTLGLFQSIWSRPNRTAAMSLTSTLSPTLINEVTLSGNSDGVGSIDPDPRCGARCDRGTYGINYPFIYPGTKWFPGKIPSMTITGLTTIDNGPYPGAWSGFVTALNNNTTKIWGNHTLKFGVALEHSGQNDHIQFTTASAPATINENGSFRFLDGSFTGFGVGNALLGLFSDYSELGGKPQTPWIGTSYEWFAQDSWKATPKLTLEYGIRHSIYPPWKSKWGSLAEFLPAFYDPKKAPVVDRAGGYITSGDPYNGIVLPGCGVPSAEGNRFPILHTSQFTGLYHCLPDGLAETHNLVFQPRVGLAYALTPKTALRAGLGAFANRTAINRDTALGGNAPFQPQTTVINGSADAPGGATPRLFPFTLTSQDPVFKVPMAWNWNATFQRDIGWGTSVEVGYVGRRGIHNQRKRNINQLQVGTIQANPGVNVNALRPFLGMGILGLAENSGLSMYHGLQVSVERRFGTGFHFGVAYTMSRSQDNSSSLTDVLPNAYDDKAYWGRSDFDRTHVFIANSTYDVPFLRGKSLLMRAIGNWELSGVFQAQSGTPFSVRNNVDYAGVGAGSGNQFWSMTGDPSMEPTSFTDSAVWFNKAAFAQPAAGTFGTQARNALRNPGFWNVDGALRKNFLTFESQMLQFRFEVFDILNHPNWGGANASPTSGSFGTVTGKSGSRALQLAL